MPNGIIAWCNRVIRIGSYLLFGLVPLLLTPLNYELFEFNKMMAVYGLTAIIVSSWLAKSVIQKELRIAKTPLDIPIVLFVLSQLISSIFSIDPHVSWFGYYSRFNGGMWSIFSYTLLYYAIVSNTDVITKPVIRSLLNIALVTGSAVAVYGVLERLGIDKHLWVQDVQNRVFSTLGQPNWLAAYLVALIPMSMAFALQAQMSKLKDQIKSKVQSSKLLDFGFDLTFGFWIWNLVALLFFLVLLFTRSRSGLLGFAVADIVFWGVVIKNFIRPPLAADKNRKGVAFFRLPVILHVIFALIIFINGTGVEKLDNWISFSGLQRRIQHQSVALNPQPAGPALEVGGTESGTIRKYVWQGAINAWNSDWKTRLIGTGTETFAFAFYQFRPVGHNLTSEWDFLYNKAHNEYLNYVATTGVFGLGSYLLFIGCFIWWFIRVHSSQILVHSKKNPSDNRELRSDLSELTTVYSALFAGWISILFTNFFGFSVVTQQLFLFLFPAIIFTRYTTYHIRFPMRPPSWVVWLPIIGGLYIVIRIGSLWYADTLYAKGYRLIRAGLYGQAVPHLENAISLRQSEPVYHDELSSTYAVLAVSAFEAGDATQAAHLSKNAIVENNRALEKSPANVNFIKTRTKIYYTLSSLDPILNAKAIESLEYAIPLSPNDPKIYYNLAILIGREGNADQAIDYLKKAISLKSNYRDAYYALWVFYTEENKPSEAAAILKTYVQDIDPNDKDFLERLK